MLANNFEAVLSWPEEWTYAGQEPFPFSTCCANDEA